MKNEIWMTVKGYDVTPYVIQDIKRKRTWTNVS